jgi:hypothetical protein
MTLNVPGTCALFLYPKLSTCGDCWVGKEAVIEMKKRCSLAEQLV